MLEQLQIWWQSQTPEFQGAFRDGGVVVAAFIVGQVLGVMVARALRAKNFDLALRFPSASPPNPNASHGITPTFIAGVLVRVTVWAAAAWWLARQHDRLDLANTLGQIITRTWALATVLVTALSLGSLMAKRVFECLQGLSMTGPELAASRNGATASSRSVAGAMGALVYGLVMLLTLLIAADFFDWPLTRSSAQALWLLAQNLLIAGAALFIGCLGARWARDLVTLDSAASPEKRAGQYTALVIVAGTTVLAVALLLSSGGVLLGVAALAVLGLLLWLVRGYLPDVGAGLQLRAHKVAEVWFDGTPWHIGEVGLLTTELSHGGQFGRVSNRRVLDARLHGTPAETVRH
jgi:hypothetical protein